MDNEDTIVGCAVNNQQMPPEIQFVSSSVHY